MWEKPKPQKKIVGEMDLYTYPLPTWLIVIDENYEKYSQKPNAFNLIDPQLETAL